MIRFICDPEKNTECTKTFCQEYCKATAFEEYAKRDEHGAPIVAKDFEIIPQIKINREVFEKCEEEKETITVSKGCLKARTGRFVVYDVEFLKRHIDIEAELYGRGKAENKDCVSRQAVLDIINFEYKWLLDAKVYDICTSIAFSAIMSKISEMPPVTPKAESKDKPKGRWIDIGDEGLVFKCSLCGLKKTIESNYCPNCGARMAESEG